MTIEMLIIRAFNHCRLWVRRWSYAGVVGMQCDSKEQRETTIGVQKTDLFYFYMDLVILPNEHSECNVAMLEISVSSEIDGRRTWWSFYRGNFTQRTCIITKITGHLKLALLSTLATPFDNVDTGHQSYLYSVWLFPWYHGGYRRSVSECKHLLWNQSGFETSRKTTRIQLIKT